MKQRIPTMFSSSPTKHIFKFVYDRPKFIPMCHGLLGNLGALTVNNDHVSERSGVSVYILMPGLKWW